jgi:hypothetical protein
MIKTTITCDQCGRSLAPVSPACAEAARSVSLEDEWNSYQFCNMPCLAAWLSPQMERLIKRYDFLTEMYRKMAEAKEARS